MTPEVRWFVVMLFALIGFLCAQFAPLDPALKSRLDSASRTAFATVLLRNGPTVAAVHGYGQASAIFSTWLGIGYLGAGLVPLGMDEDEIPIVAVYLTVLNISMTCWCFGLLMGIAKVISPSSQLTSITAGARLWKGPTGSAAASSGGTHSARDAVCGVVAHAVVVEHHSSPKQVSEGGYGVASVRGRGHHVH
eukprot:TRINITY_DN984_c0_g1_i1.p1 TRINITY_DN984_c0_g1~~TRINITY_DN984_c0_g1_i1.p1  ORF type:complete len:193 (+),score=19.07 TRINITY_DN984_c0_g1_i1:78-656(+)